jgi:hypothetical protein
MRRARNQLRVIAINAISRNLHAMDMMVWDAMRDRTGPPR